MGSNERDKNIDRAVQVEINHINAPDLKGRLETISTDYDAEMATVCDLALLRLTVLHAGSVRRIEKIRDEEIAKRNRPKIEPDHGEGLDL